MNRPIVMLADRQAEGGYPKIATVASVNPPRRVLRAASNLVRFYEENLIDGIVYERDHASR